MRPTDSFLDVGAGAGRYTFAVAPLVARATAIEPSPGMRAALEQEAGTRGLANITVVPTTWEEADVEPHDVILVSSVLYFVVDVVPFLQKLHRSARRVCYIFHRVEDRASMLGWVWQELAGNRPPEPGFIDLYNLLFAMGIRPNAQIFGTSQTARYESIEDAVLDARQMLGLDPEDHARDQRLRAFLTSHLVEEKGRLGFPSGPQMAVIWWEKP